MNYGDKFETIPDGKWKEGVTIMSGKIPKKSCTSWKESVGTGPETITGKLEHPDEVVSTDMLGDAPFHWPALASFDGCTLREDANHDR